MQWHLHSPLKRMPQDDEKRKNKIQALKTLIEQASRSTNPFFKLVEADDVPSSQNKLEYELSAESSNYIESNTVYCCNDTETSSNKSK